MRHMAGVGALDHQITYEVATDQNAFSDLLARQPHNFDGKRVHSYHAITQGWYINKIIRRVDPQRRTIDDFARGFNEKWGMEWYLKPDAVEELDLTRISKSYEPPVYQILAPMIATLFDPREDKTIVKGALNKKSLLYRTIVHPNIDGSLSNVMNKDPKHRAIEGPAYSGHSNAESVYYSFGKVTNIHRLTTAYIQRTRWPNWPP